MSVPRKCAQQHTEHTGDAGLTKDEVRTQEGFTHDVTLVGVRGYISFSGLKRMRCHAAVGSYSL